MARRIKIQERSCPSIKEAFDDFLLHKKASGLAEKTCRTYSEQFAAICKHLDSSAPITSLVNAIILISNTITIFSSTIRLITNTEQ